MAWDSEPPTKDELGSSSPKGWDADPPSPAELAASASHPARTGAAALEGLGQGLTLGYANNLQAAAAPYLAKIYDAVTGNDIAPEVEAEGYVKRRDDMIKRREALQKEAPGSYLGGNLAGTVLSTALPGVGTVGKIGKGATTLGQVARAAAAQGAVLGAIQNPGEKEGEVSPLQLGSRLGNAAIGGGTGFVAGGAIGLASRAPEGLKKLAELKAFKSLGPYQRDMLKAVDKDTVRQVGRTALDEGVISGMPSSLDTIASRAQGAKDAAGGKIDDYLVQLSKAEQAAAAEAGMAPNLTGEPGMMSASLPSSAGVSRKQVADSLRQELLAADTSIPGAAQKNKAIERLIKQFESGGDELIPILENERLKRSVGKEINWDRLPGADIPITEKVQRSLYGKLRQGTEDAAQFLENQAGGPALGKFQQLKQKFGDLSTATDIANKRFAKEEANRLFSPSDYATGLFGAGAGFASGGSTEDKLKNAALGAGAGILHKGFRQYGNQAIAVGADKGSKMLTETVLKAFPQIAKAAEKNPAVVQMFIQNMINRSKFKEATPEERARRNSTIAEKEN